MIQLIIETSFRFLSFLRLCRKVISTLLNLVNGVASMDDVDLNQKVIKVARNPFDATCMSLPEKSSLSLKTAEESFSSPIHPHYYCTVFT